MGDLEQHRAAAFSGEHKSSKYCTYHETQEAKTNFRIVTYGCLFQVLGVLV